MICTNCTLCIYNLHNLGPPLCKSGRKLSLSLLRSLSLSHILLSNRVRDSYILCGLKLSLSLLRSLSLIHILLMYRVRDSYILCVLSGTPLSRLGSGTSLSLSHTPTHHCPIQFVTRMYYGVATTCRFLKTRSLL